jgi:2'-5' RNA ligase
MRLFIGIELPAEVRADVAGIADGCRRRIARVAPRAVLRWIPEDNLHITLWFLGDVDEPRTAVLMEALRQPFQTTAFTARLGGLGAYPPSGGPRVIWQGIDEGREGLQSLHAELAIRLPAAGFEAEHRPYSPHVSLARVKDVPRSESTAVRTALERPAGAADPDPFEVTGLTLFKSRTLPSGSEYQSLLRVPLKGCSP